MEITFVSSTAPLKKSSVGIKSERYFDITYEDIIQDENGQELKIPLGRARIPHDAFKEYLQEVHHYKNYLEAKEDLYITALTNSIRKFNFIELCYKYETNQMSEEEYNNELKNNRNKYTIKLQEPKEDINIRIAKEIVGKIENIGQLLEPEDAEELFSLQPYTLLPPPK